MKYRRKALYSDDIQERLKDIVWNLSNDLGIEVVAHEPAEDHYHLLFKATPKTNLVNVVNGLLEGGMILHQNNFVELKRFLR